VYPPGVGPWCETANRRGNLRRRDLRDALRLAGPKPAQWDAAAMRWSQGRTEAEVVVAVRWHVAVTIRRTGTSGAGPKAVPATFALEVPVAGPAQSVALPHGSYPYQSRHHSHTLPSMSKRPQTFVFFWCPPDGSGRRCLDRATSQIHELTFCNYGKTVRHGDDTINQGPDRPTPCSPAKTGTPPRHEICMQSRQRINCPHPEDPATRATPPGPRCGNRADHYSRPGWRTDGNE
jgi:hypothetical protein